MLRLDSDVQFVKGVGPRRAALLNSRGVRTVGDLLLRIPKAYQDRSKFASLASLRAGQDAAVHAKIYRSRAIQTHTRGRILELVLTDGTSFAYAKWFHGGSLGTARGFTAGRQIILYGRVDRDNRESKLVFFNPEFELLDEAEDSQGSQPSQPSASLDVGRIVPVYEEMGGMTSRQLRRILWSALADLANPLDDPIPAAIRSEHNFPDLSTCLQHIHFPAPGDNIDDLNRRASPPHRRLIFEEFFLLELVFALRRKQLQLTRGVRFETDDRIRSCVKKILPFHPTAAQKRVLKEIVEDLKAPHPMNRLLQGDVGSGKTIVAFETVVVAVENGYQAAIMAPTEILAEQHYLNAKRVLAPLGYSMGVLRRGIKKAEKRKLFEDLAAGNIQVIIGTHVLFEESTVFRKLGLVIIDEQHRFGVVQRLRLMTKGDQPNTLVMTATPIPRTLAMTLYGDLDLSVIDEMPPGRSPIKTIHATERDANEIYGRLADEMRRGRQCYVVYPVIEESEKVDLKSATEGAEKLAKVFQDRKVALLHGRLRSEEKEAIMRAFAAGEVDVLVATTVVEVGVDVANATVMVIEHAERFGLAQLHQLRGRVGRGRQASLCVLMTPVKIGDVARERIDAMVSTLNGFRLAEVDLRLRGPGEMAGTRQSGLPEFRVANLMEDSLMLALAQAEAKKYVESEEQALRLLKELSARSSSITPAGLVTVG
jgi:ATP-dependent DNA helicase RecG